MTKGINARGCTWKEREGISSSGGARVTVGKLPGPATRVREGGIGKAMMLNYNLSSDINLF